MNQEGYNANLSKLGEQVHVHCRKKVKEITQIGSGPFQLGMHAPKTLAWRKIILHTFDKKKT